MKRESADYKDNLTNEQLLKRFKNQFELVRYAIQLADNMIRSGRDSEVYTDSQNVAFQVLAEIAANKEQFGEVPVLPTYPQAGQSQDKPRQGNGASPSWNDEVRAFKEEKKEKRGKSKSAR